MGVLFEEKDIDIAAKLLHEKYRISPQMLHKLYSADWHNAIQAVNRKLYSDNLSNYDNLIGYNFCRLVVTKEGCNLFSGVEKQGLRKAILS